ncbi:MAG: ychF [Dehalococcoidia bacterium]|nr:ychF [Dehalococcoidia bacterium]
MEIGIIGLPKSGKTTIFNALTVGHAETAAHHPSGLEPNVGMVKVPDPRLDKLVGIFSPKRVAPAEVKYVDVAGSSKGFGKGEGIGGPFLSYLGGVDAIIHVVRSFQNDSIPHVEGSVNPHRDIATMNLEMAFSDMAILERRIDRLRDGLKAAKPQERDAIAIEEVWLQELKNHLENEVPLREQGLTEDQVKKLLNYSLLTLKPIITAINIGEESLAEATELESQYRERYERPGCEVVALCGVLEMEMGEMDQAEAQAFRTAWELPTEPGLHRLIRTSYALLGIHSFFTVGPDEVKAWSVPEGTSAPKAAGKIHSDIERGFIRAEVIGWKDLTECGGLVEARRRGLLRLEGKTYTVKDGDVITFLFNI